MLPLLFIVTGCTLQPSPAVTNSNTALTYQQQETGADAPNYDLPKSAELTALASEVENGDEMIADLDLATASDEEIFIAYGELLGKQTDAKFVPGQVLVEINHAFTKAEVISLLEQANFLVPATGDISNENVVIINSIGDLEKKAVNSAYIASEDELITTTLSQLENTGQLDCRDEGTTFIDNIITCRFGDLRQSDVQALIDATAVTDSKIFYLQPLEILVPYHEEQAWAQHLAEWEEIEAADPNFIQELF